MKIFEVEKVPIPNELEANAGVSRNLTMRNKIWSMMITVLKFRLLRQIVNDGSANSWLLQATDVVIDNIGAGCCVKRLVIYLDAHHRLDGPSNPDLLRSWFSGNTWTRMTSMFNLVEASEQPAKILWCFKNNQAAMTDFSVWYKQVSFDKIAVLIGYNFLIWCTYICRKGK